MGLINQEQLLEDDITRALISGGKRPRRKQMLAFLRRNGRAGLRAVAVDLAVVELVSRINEKEKRAGIHLPPPRQS